MLPVESPRDASSGTKHPEGFSQQQAVPASSK
jgi:hypothetical protein